MNNHPSHPPRGSWTSLWFFGIFTAIAVAGFAVFGRNPQLLSGYPDLLSFYAISFRFFAQAQVLIGAAVLFFYLSRTAGWAWLSALLVAYGASLASELLGTATGLPFGPYEYGSLLGIKWFGLVPLLIPLSWFLMALPAYALSRRRFPDRLPVQMLFGAALLTAWDLALDPAMSSLTNYWSWGEAGIYYGMPLVNLLGWMLTGLAIMGLMHAVGAWRWTKGLSTRWLVAYYLITLLMPIGMLVAAGMWLAVGMTTVVVGPLLLLSLGDRRAPSNNPPRDVSQSSAHLPVKEFVRRRAEEAGATNTFFSRHSKSFSFAARWFSIEERRLIAGLYAFCRTTDDMADRDLDVERIVMKARLLEWRVLVDTAYHGGSTNIAWLDEILSTSKARGVPLSLAHELIEGVRMDVDAVRIQNWKELEEYMYRVASVVGIWMCHLFDITDPGAHRRAAALGQAMQLTNILRDVGEDLEQDRIYLPANFLHRYGLDEDDLRRMQSNGEVPAAYRALMHELIGRAEALYEYAAPGFAALPKGFRRASAVASSVYRGIHREIRRNGYDNVRQRAATSLFRKIILAVRGLADLTHISADERRPANVKALTVAKNAVGLGLMAMLSLPNVGFAHDLPVKRGFAAQKAVTYPPTSELREVIDDGKPTCPPIPDVRERYVAAVEKVAVVEETLSAIEGCESTMHRAYEGAFITLKAKHAFWPHAKLRHVRDGLDGLDGLVREHPANVEIRYLRLLSAYFLPSILGRTWSVREDLQALRELLPGAADDFPPELYEAMVRFVAEDES